MRDLKIKTIGVIGAGAWGTAVACLFADKETEVRIWDRKQEVIEEINNQHTNNAYLPNIALHKKIKAVRDLQELAEVDLIAIAVPAQHIREVAKSLQFCSAKGARYEKSIFLICAKGIENSTGHLLSDLM